MQPKEKALPAGIVTAPALRPESLLRAHEAAALLGLTPTHFKALVEAGTLPEPIMIGTRATRWQVSDLQEALAKLREPAVQAEFKAATRARTANATRISAERRRERRERLAAAQQEAA